MKHAYLILAHDHPDVLDRLIKELDHKDIKMFIHFDKKANFDVEKFIKDHKSFNISYIKRIKIYWGTYSQINITLKLLEVASKEKFDYYHLISGVTLPIKPLEYILKFYEDNKGKEFVNVHPMHNDRMFVDRYTKLHLFPVRSKFMRFKVFRLINKITTCISRNYPPKDPFYYKLSWSWFSITHDFCNYLLAQKKWIYKKFKFGLCCDEVYIATILFHSKFKDNIYYKSLTYVDFNDKYNQKGPAPSILTDKYLNDLRKCDCLYARKFDSDFVNFYDKIRC